MSPDFRKYNPVLQTSWKKAPVFFLVLKLRCLPCSFISAPSFPISALNVMLYEFWYPPSFCQPKCRQGRTAAWGSERARQVYLLLTDGLELLTSSLEFPFSICEMVIPSARRLGRTIGELYGPWQCSSIYLPKGLHQTWMLFLRATPLPKPLTSPSCFLGRCRASAQVVWVEREADAFCCFV